MSPVSVFYWRESRLVRQSLCLAAPATLPPILAGGQSDECLRTAARQGALRLANLWASLAKGFLPC